MGTSRRPTLSMRWARVHRNSSSSRPTYAQLGDAIMTKEGDVTIKRSPKGLVETTTKRGMLLERQSSDEKGEMIQLSPLAQDHGFELEPIEPGVYAIKGGPARQEINNCIAFWRAYARDLIEADGKKPTQYAELAHAQVPEHLAGKLEALRAAIRQQGLGHPAEYTKLAHESETLDRACAAARLLTRLDRVQACLERLVRRSANDVIYDLIYEIFLFASEVHQLTVIDNENAIAAWLRSIEGAREGGKAKSANVMVRNMRMALEFQRRRAKGSGTSDSALKAEIGAGEGLHRRASIDAINAGLKILASLPPGS
jgi:hypothetical protein